MKSRGPQIIVLLAMTAFLLVARNNQPQTRLSLDVADRIVLPAVVQVPLYGGERYLASNMELIRAATLGTGVNETNIDYIIRSHQAASRLNPCNEDNYYLSAALLSWGGAPTEGSDILQRATECRFWDEFPPFFYAMNEYFFHKNSTKAQQAMEVAAQRASKNAAVFRKVAIMIGAEELDDAQLILDYLRHQRDSSEDPKLRAMIDKRVVRMEGLIQLRYAKQEYESRFGQPLQYPSQLIESGIIEAFPQDPLRLGYEFSNGEFTLKKIKILGVER